MDMTKSLAEIATWLLVDSPVDVPAIERRARLLFLDTLGCMIAGLAKPEPKALVASLACLDPGRITLPGAASPLTTGSAAYIAGLAACWDEACEGLPRAHGRPGLHAFAAVRHVHYGAQAAIEWRRRHGQGGTSGIHALDLSIYGEAMTYCGDRAPTTPIQAQFSLSYGLAWALANGDLAPNAYDVGSLNEPEVRRLEALVTITEEPQFSSENKRAARLTVRTAEGSETLAVMIVPGDADMPLSAREVEDKFVRYASPVVGTGRAGVLASALLEASLSSSLRDLLAG